MGENGLLNRAKTAAEENRKAEAIEDVKLRIMEVQTEKEGKATLEDLVEYLENNTTNEYRITKVSGGTASLVEGSIESSEVGNAEKIYITSVKYGYEIEVNSNMTVTERVVTSSLGGQSSSGSGSGSGEVTGGVSQEEYDDLSTEYENFRKAVAQSIEDAGGTSTSYDANTSTFDTNIKAIATTLTTQLTQFKTTIANAITGKGVTTNATDTAATMATNIGNISGDDDIVYPRYKGGAEGEVCMCFDMSTIRNKKIYIKCESTTYVDNASDEGNGNYWTSLYTISGEREIDVENLISTYSINASTYKYLIFDTFDYNKIYYAYAK